MRVILEPGESFEHLLARFHREVAKAEILSEYKDHMEFITPSEQRHLKQRRRLPSRQRR